MPSLSKSVNALFEQEKWEQARRLLQDQLAKKPEDHWLLARISTTFYEEKDYATALKYIKKAYTNNPKCPLVLWTLANTQAMLERWDEAIATYKKILALGSKKIAYGDHGEGMEWAISLILDTIFRMGVCFQRNGDYRGALQRYLLHLKRREEHDVPSIYSEEQVLEHIQQLLNL